MTGRSIFSGFAGAMVASLLLAAAIAAPASRPQADETVKIGFASPLTGPQAPYGKDNENGARLAIEDINSRRLTIGGQPVQFELVVQDDQADPRTGTLVAQRLVDDKIAGMVGHFNSGVTIPASRIYSRAGIPELSVSTNVKYTRQGYPTTFRVMADDNQQGEALGAYAVKTLGLKKLAVIDDRTAYGQGLADQFAATVEKAGGKVVKREFTNDRATDFTAILTSIRASQPDAIFFGGYDAQAGPMAKQIRQLGIQAALLGGETIKTQKFIDLAGDAAEGNYASTPGAALERRPQGPEFAKRYKERFHQEVELYAPYFYDSVMAIAAAMKKADSTDASKYLTALKTIEYEGVTATIAFSDRGDLKNSPLSMYRVKDGKWILLENYQASNP